MIYKETEPVAIENATLTVIVEDVSETTEDPKIKKALVKLLKTLTEYKHAYTRCCKVQETLNKVCEVIICNLNSYFSEFTYPSIEECSQKAVDSDSVVTLYNDIIHDINSFIEESVSLNEWMFVTKMQAALTIIDEALCKLKKNDK